MEYIIIPSIFLCLFTGQWLYYKWMSWKESERFWKAFEAKMKRDEEERNRKRKEAIEATAPLIINYFKKKQQERLEN